MIVKVLLFYCALAFSLAVLLNIAGGSLYTIKRLKKQQDMAKHPFSRRYRVRPKVTVVVIAQNAKESIAKCLASILASRYKNLEILVVDCRSKDGTKKIVQSFIKTKPNKQIKVISIRDTNNDVGIVKSGMKNSTGELLLFLDKNAFLGPQTIINAVSSFNYKPSLEALVCREQSEPNNSLAGIYQSFSLMLRNHSLKTADNFRGVYLRPLTTNIFYRKESLKQTFGSRFILNSQYGSDTSVFLPSGSITRLMSLAISEQSFRFNLLKQELQSGKRSNCFNWRIIPYLLYLGVIKLALLSLPVVLIYFFYLAIVLRQPELLILSLLAITTALVYVISQSEGSNLPQKIKYILLIPIFFSWYVIDLLLQYVSILLLLPDHYSKATSNLRAVSL